MSRMAFVAVSVWMVGWTVLAMAAPPMPAPPVAGESPTPPPLAPPLAASTPIPAEQLSAWVRDLDADEYTAREAATRELIEAGPSAIEALARGVVSDSPEAAWRSSEALQQIALQGDETALARATAALDSASRAGKVGAAAIADNLRTRQQQLQHDRATAKLRALGAKLPEVNESQPTIWLGGGLVGVPIAVDFGGDMVVEVIAAADDLGPGRPVIEAEVGELEVDAPDKPLPLKAMEETLERLADLTEQPEENPAIPDSTVPIVEGVALAPPAADAPPALTTPEAELETPEAEVAEIAAPVPEVPLVPDLPVDEPAPPPDDMPLHVEDEKIVEFAPEAIVADAIFIGDAFGSGVADSAGATGLTESLVLDADWKGGDDGLAVLREVPSLVQVTIDSALLSDAALPHFAALPKLAELRIKNTKLSAAALYKLRNECKDLQIIAQGPALLGVHAEMTGGCVLTGVYQGSGAATAGLKTGDEIVTIDGHAVNDFSDLTIAVYAHAPGDTLHVEVRRDGQKRMFDVVLKGRADLDR